MQTNWDATGVRRSRKMLEKCISDHMYIYLMQCYRPDHRTISDFRKNNIQEIEKYIVDIVRVLSELGYRNVGKIWGLHKILDRLKKYLQKIPI